MCHLEHVTLFYYIASEEKLTRSGSEEKLTRSGQPKRPFVCQVWDYFLHKCYRSNHTAPKGSNVTSACISSCSRARCLEILVVFKRRPKVFYGTQRHMLSPAGSSSRSTNVEDQTEAVREKPVAVETASGKKLATSSTYASSSEPSGRLRSASNPCTSAGGF